MMQVQRYNFFMNCANFLEYNPKIYIIFWNTIHKIHAFCDYVYQNQTELYKLENIDVHIYVCNLSHSIPRKQAGSLVPAALWCATHSQHFPRRNWLATCWKTLFFKGVAALPPLKSTTVASFWFGYLISYRDNLFRHPSFVHGQSMLFVCNS